MPDDTLVIDDDDRYSRLRLIAWWDQERLAHARVLVVGAGAAGLSCALQAAHDGARVLVVEKDVRLGGTLHHMRRPLMEQFVCARQVSTNGLDLSLFQFDTDQSFAVFLLNADGTIYGRFGYGAASLDVTLTLGRGTELAADDALDAAAQEVTTHMVPAGTPEAMAAIQRAHLLAAEHTLGAVTRTEAMARVWFRDFPVARGSKEPLQVLLATRGDNLHGYALVRRSSQWEHNVPQGEVTVREIGATDPAALLALARRVVDFDLTGKVTLHGRGLDDPILWWAGGPRSAALRAGDSLWVRLVDVDKALTARGYAAPADVVLDVVDPVCPWNERRWRLTVGSDGVGRCLPTEDAPDLRMPVAALGAAYLGSRPIAAQAAAGQVTELRPGAAAELSRAMRGDVEPVAAIGF